MPFDIDEPWYYKCGCLERGECESSQLWPPTRKPRASRTRATTSGMGALHPDSNEAMDLGDANRGDP